MATKAIDSNSKFNIYSSFTLSNDDVAAVSLLYAPLMGSDALMIYLGFCSLLERNNLKSEEMIHQDFLDIYSFTPLAFTKARIKLEGIGLLMTYETKEKNLIYVICPPLTPKNFLKDVTLGLYLYSKIRKETFEFIYEHFKIEKIDKSNCTLITKSFDEVYSSQTYNDVTFDKFKYILGKKPNRNLKIKDYKFDFDEFGKAINKDYLEIGVTKNFKEQICNLAFVYGFDEFEMVRLYQESINKSGIYDYRLLKNNANKLFVYKKNLNAPKLVPKDEVDYAFNDVDLVEYLEKTPIATILLQEYPDLTALEASRVSEIQAELSDNLHIGVINCMIIKTKNDLGEIPALNYFKNMAKTWMMDNVLSTADAVKYITTLRDNKQIKHYNYNYNSKRKLGKTSSIDNKKINDMLKELNEGWDDDE